MIDQFGLRLSETSRWCASKARVDDPAHSLRSHELVPRQETEDWQAIVESVCDRRARLLQGQWSSAPAVPAGRLLVFDPGQSLSDGAAMVESNGFFDVDNAPPWDTWIAYVREQPHQPGSWTNLDSYLLCWIPTIFLDLVERGIAVNPERCLLWADVADTPFLRRLRDQQR